MTFNLRASSQIRCSTIHSHIRDNPNPDPEPNLDPTILLRRVSAVLLNWIVIIKDTSLMMRADRRFAMSFSLRSFFGLLSFHKLDADL